MNKSKIVAELENMVVARLFGRQPWLADRETCCAVNRKLKQMGLWEVVCVEPKTWQFSPLGKELDVLLFLVFMGFINAWDAPHRSAPADTGSYGRRIGFARGRGVPTVVLRRPYHESPSRPLS